MKSFKVAALIAASASAEYQLLRMQVDDNDDEVKYFRSQLWSEADAVENSTGILTKTNNSIYIRDETFDGANYAFKPLLRGGSLQYDVDLSSLGCGCVAGAYLVKIDDQDCSEDKRTIDNPNCPSIDVMQANPFGFNTSSNPCPNGVCESTSQCELNMRDEVTKQNLDGNAYGPNGSIIDTNFPFTVKTEFLSDSDYSTLWGQKTRITQGTQEIVMMADCPDYIGMLSENIEGNMGIVFSSWDNSSGQGADFESDQCQLPASSCDSSEITFSNLVVLQYGSSEDQDPEASNFYGFMAISDDENYGNWEMYLRGLDGGHIKTDGSEICMGENNRAFVLDYEQDDSTYWSYKHDLVGGSFQFTVDVSDVGCGCAAGVFAVNLNDEECSWNAKGSNTTPQCSSIQIMESNLLAFNVESNPCEFGSCDMVSQCKGSVGNQDIGVMNYGPSSSYKIDTTMPYHVWTQFFADSDEEGYATEVVLIRTTLTQGEEIVIIEQDCPDYIQYLTGKLSYDMSIGISTYFLDQDTEQDVGGSCESACSAAKLKISDLEWIQGDSINAFGGSVWGNPAPTLESGDCELGCTECREQWQSSTPNNVSYQCKDTTVYKYTNKCGRKKDKSLCMEDDSNYCHMSWPADDKDKWQSENAACRTVPRDYIIEDLSDWDFSNKTCRRSNQHLCKYGCDGGQCRNSWPDGDSMRWKSAKAMCRCTTG